MSGLRISLACEILPALPPPRNVSLETQIATPGDVITRDPGFMRLFIVDCWSFLVRVPTFITIHLAHNLMTTGHINRSIRFWKIQRYALCFSSATSLATDEGTLRTHYLNEAWKGLIGRMILIGLNDCWVKLHFDTKLLWRHCKTQPIDLTKKSRSSMIFLLTQSR